MSTFPVVPESINRYISFSFNQGELFALLAKLQKHRQYYGLICNEGCEVQVGSMGNHWGVITVSPFLAAAQFDVDKASQVFEQFLRETVSGFRLKDSGKYFASYVFFHSPKNFGSCKQVDFSFMPKMIQDFFRRSNLRKSVKPYCSKRVLKVITAVIQKKARSQFNGKLKTPTNIYSFLLSGEKVQMALWTVENPNIGNLFFTISQKTRQTMRTKGIDIYMELISRLPTSFTKVKKKTERYYCLMTAVAEQKAEQKAIETLASSEECNAIEKEWQEIEENNQRRFVSNIVKMQGQLDKAFRSEHKRS